MSKQLMEEIRCQVWGESINVSRTKGQKLEIKVDKEGYRAILAYLESKKAVLLTLVGNDERPIDGTYGLYTVFYLPSQDLVEVHLPLNQEDPSYPAATTIISSAHWLEREIKDLLGLVPMGHPDLRRLAVHPDWPREVYPLRKDFGPKTNVTRDKGQFDFCKVEGEGINQIPVGPIHAGIIEPGHFRFYTFGEDIINLQAQLFYTHRGVEKNAEGRHYMDVMLLAERICGVCSVSHSVSYAQAVEALVSLKIPQRARYLRTILLEMERIYNHIGDIGNMCAGIGFALGISRGAILKEKVMRKNLELAGHRYLRGVIIPGGVKKDIPQEGFSSWLGDVETELKALVSVILDSNGLLDRMQTTGILHYEDAMTLGAVGPAARASGVDRDLRRDLPYAAYDKLSFEVPLQQDGDVFSRLGQRIAECFQSFKILQHSLTDLPPGELSVEVPKLPSYQTSVGWSESARGGNVHWIMSGKDSSIYRYMIRSASHCNWPVLPLCVPGNIIPDFPLINKSFELCYACLDR